MWHLKTKLGVFWIMESETDDHKYFLGIDDDSLGEYDSAERAQEDVENHSTGYIKWDETIRIKTPHSLKEWDEGEPDNWE